MFRDTTGHTYDAIKRLTKAEVKNTAGTTLRTFNYTYDRHSNTRREKTTGTTPGLQTGELWMAYNDGDEICASITQFTDPSLS